MGARRETKTPHGCARSSSTFGVLLRSRKKLLAASLIFCAGPTLIRSAFSDRPNETDNDAELPAPAHGSLRIPVMCQNRSGGCAMTNKVVS